MSQFITKNNIYNWMKTTSKLPTLNLSNIMRYKDQIRQSHHNQDKKQIANTNQNIPKVQNNIFNAILKSHENSLAYKHNETTMQGLNNTNQENLQLQSQSSIKISQPLDELDSSRILPVNSKPLIASKQFGFRLNKIQMEESDTIKEDIKLSGKIGLKMVRVNQFQKNMKLQYDKQRKGSKEVINSYKKLQDSRQKYGIKINQIKNRASINRINSQSKRAQINNQQSESKISNNSIIKAKKSMSIGEQVDAQQILPQSIIKPTKIYENENYHTLPINSNVKSKYSSNTPSPMKGQNKLTKKVQFAPLLNKIVQNTQSPNNKIKNITTANTTANTKIVNHQSNRRSEKKELVQKSDPVISGFVDISNKSITDNSYLSPKPSRKLVQSQQKILRGSFNPNQTGSPYAADILFQVFGGMCGKKQENQKAQEKQGTKGEDDPFLTQQTAQFILKTFAGLNKKSKTQIQQMRKKMKNQKTLRLKDYLRLTSLSNDVRYDKYSRSLDKSGDATKKNRYNIKDSTNKQKNLKSNELQKHSFLFNKNKMPINPQKSIALIKMSLNKKLQSFIQSSQKLFQIILQPDFIGDEYEDLVFVCNFHRIYQQYVFSSAQNLQYLFVQYQGKKKINQNIFSKDVFNEDDVDHMIQDLSPRKRGKKIQTKSWLKDILLKIIDMKAQLTDNNEDFVKQQDN